MLNLLFRSIAALPSLSRSMSEVFLTLGSHCTTLLCKCLYEYLKHPHDKLHNFQSTEHATLHQLNAVLPFHTPFLLTPHLFSLSSLCRLDSLSTIIIPLFNSFTIFHFISLISKPRILIESNSLQLYVAIAVFTVLT